LEEKLHQTYSVLIDFQCTYVCDLEFHYQYITPMWASGITFVPIDRSGYAKCWTAWSTLSDYLNSWLSL